MFIEYFNFNFDTMILLLSAKNVRDTSILTLIVIIKCQWLGNIRC